jgi:hypothetical protein
MSKMSKQLLSLCGDCPAASSSSSAGPAGSGSAVTSSGNDDAKGDDETVATTPETTTNTNTASTSSATLAGEVTERLCAAVCRELLKLGNSKWLDKVFLKICLNPLIWLG